MTWICVSDVAEADDSLCSRWPVMSEDIDEVLARRAAKSNSSTTRPPDAFDGMRTFEVGRDAGADTVATSEQDGGGTLVDSSWIGDVDTSGL